MAMGQKIQRQSPPSRIELRNGDHMSQSEFHQAYDSMPESYRAELIAGIVYEPSPLGYLHGRNDIRLSSLLDHYAGKTSGVDAASGATVILSDEDEVQPDVLLRIIPERGGRSRNTKEVAKKPFYVAGAPELVAEIAHSIPDFRCYAASFFLR
jgi:Uma2 family endonuclease